KNLSPEGILPHGFGWRQHPLRGMSDATIWHTGWTGQAVIIDPEKKAFIILLTNRRCNVDEFQKLKEDVAAILIRMV
ncbi:MAG: serine hydrolase domain-containing protein, partial [Anaerovoracaceae bacterium]